MRSIAFVFGLVVVAGCGSKPTPLEVCGKLQAAGDLLTFQRRVILGIPPFVHGAP